MKKIGKTKLTMNKEMLVVVYADVYMQDSDDADDLYFVMFNILADPLRLSLCVVSEFFEASIIDKYTFKKSEKIEPYCLIKIVEIYENPEELKGNQRTWVTYTN